MIRTNHLVISLVLMPALLSTVPGRVEAVQDTFSDGQQNMELVGYNDLQGRESLQVTTRGDWVYVGHHPGQHFNPLTGTTEFNGTTIIDISDPKNPTTVVHIPNAVRTTSRSAAVMYDYRGSGKDYLIRNHEVSGGASKYEIFDITERAQPRLVGEIAGTPPDSCGTGCGGLLTMAHKGWWASDGLFYNASNEPGFRSGAHLLIFDVKDVTAPVFVGRAWLPGQKETEPELPPEPWINTPHRLNWHHPILDEEANMVYGAYLSGGNLVSFDVTDPSSPKLAWHFDSEPVGRGTHTISPIHYEHVPNFGEEALPRTYALVTDEGVGADIQCANPIRTKVYMLDITHADLNSPYPISTWQVPDGDFCDKGGRFGSHQFAETIDGALNRFEDKIAYVAYFNAGVRALDISDPYNMEEVGYYIPRANERTNPIAPGQPLVIQINDVDIDHRGLIYASDRVGSGLFVLEHTK